MEPEALCFWVVQLSVRACIPPAFYRLVVYYAPTLEGGGAFWNSAIRPSVRPMAQLPRL